jgi:hypothetical protein
MNVAAYTRSAARTKHRNSSQAVNALARGTAAAAVESRRFLVRRKANAG